MNVVMFSNIDPLALVGWQIADIMARTVPPCPTGLSVPV
jgi:hypothetical protein